MINSRLENEIPPSATSSEYHHKALIVDDEMVIRKAMGRILKLESVKPVFASNAREALEYLNTVKHPFSLIIADQRMPGTHMRGTDLLELAKKISPHTIRFLVTSHSQIEVIINAVNKGAIQRFIPKPWRTEDLRAAIQISLKRYERFLEREKLFSLAKKQSVKLYTLNRELMEVTETHNARLNQLDKELQAITARSHGPDMPDAPTRDELLPGFLQLLEKEPEDKQTRLNHFYSKTLMALFSEMESVAQKNGIELPETLLPGGLHDVQEEDPTPSDPGE
ncbi:MAG: response regulator [Desulfobacterales bacterium]|nr:response regulator [Desulfobacterales bacterium]